MYIWEKEQIVKQRFNEKVKGKYKIDNWIPKKQLKQLHFKNLWNSSNAKLRGKFIIRNEFVEK